MLWAETSLGEWMWIWIVETERRFEELRPSLVVEIEDAANFLCEVPCNSGCNSFGCIHIQRHPMKKDEPEHISTNPTGSLSLIWLMAAGGRAP